MTATAPPAAICAGYARPAREATEARRGRTGAPCAALAAPGYAYCVPHLQAAGYVRCLGCGIGWRRPEANLVRLRAAADGRTVPPAGPCPSCGKAD